MAQGNFFRYLQSLTPRKKSDWINLVAPFVLSFFGAILTSVELYRAVGGKAKDPLEAQVTTTLQALQENSRQAIDLTARLQTEVANRTMALQEMETTLEELRHRRTLLDLSPEQQKALQTLTHRSPTAGEIFTSLDFWLGKVLVSIINSALFFALGIWYQQRRARISLATASENQQQPNDQSPTKIPDPR